MLRCSCNFLTETLEMFRWLFQSKMGYSFTKDTKNTFKSLMKSLKLLAG